MKKTIYINTSNSELYRGNEVLKNEKDGEYFKDNNGNLYIAYVNDPKYLLDNDYEDLTRRISLYKPILFGKDEKIYSLNHNYKDDMLYLDKHLITYIEVDEDYSLIITYEKHDNRFITINSNNEVGSYTIGRHEHCIEGDIYIPLMLINYRNMLKSKSQGEKR